MIITDHAVLAYANNEKWLARTGAPVFADRKLVYKNGFIPKYRKHFLANERMATIENGGKHKKNSLSYLSNPADVKTKTIRLQSLSRNSTLIGG